MKSIILAGLGLICFAIPGSAFDIRFEGAEDGAALRAFASDIRSALPPRAATRIDRPVLIRFADLDGAAELEDVCPSGDKTAKPPVLGQTWNSSWARDRFEIQIHRGFIKEIVKGADGSRSIGCLHGTMYKTALATVLHELGHVLDSSHRFSGSKQYRGLTDWSSGIAGASAKNVLTNRSPDDYEFKNPAESFAVNFEYFLLDPEYACRRPAVARYYSGQFGAPASRADCSPYSKVSLSPDDRPADLDPSRIYAVHFLFASKGPAMMSRWGHAMYRLIVCAPERKEVGPDCLKDVSRHVVAGYRANVLDAQIDYWKGLTGGYPSRLFFYSFANIILEYNQEELRDLISLPMSLSEERKTMFVEHLLEQQWGYEGRYSFFTNNCATEAGDAISGSIDSAHKLHENSSISPLGLYEDLAQAGLIDPNLLEPRDQAIGKGYFYPSRRPDLEAAFAKLKQSMPSVDGFDYGSFDQFKEESKPMERRGYLKTGEPEQAAALYVLEKHMSQSLVKKLAATASAAIEDREQWPEKSRGSLDAAFEYLERLKPWNRIEGAGYGIPRKAELQDESQLNQFRVALAGAGRKVAEAVKSAAPELFRELRSSQENLRRFGRALKLEDPAIAE